MKVVLLTGWYYPDSVGGTEAYVRSLASDLQEMDCHVTVAAPTASGEAAVSRSTHDGVEVVRYPIDPEPSLPEVRGDAPPAGLDRFREWLEGANPDVVHMHSVTRGCGFYHARTVRELGIPLVLTVHVPGVTCPRGTMMRWGGTPCDGELRPYRCGACCLQRRGVPVPLALALAGVSRLGVRAPGSGRMSTALNFPRLLERRRERTLSLFGMSEKIVAVAGWLRDVLVLNEAPEEKVQVSLHGIAPPPRAVKASPPGDPVTAPLRIGYVGRFHPVKGVHVLLAALRSLPADLPVRLDLYGTASGSEETAYLESLEREAGSDPRIRFHGPLPGERKMEIYSSFDLLAVPSIWFETGPFVVLEAFACGVPVLGSRLGGIAEKVRHGVSGWLVEPRSDRSWAAAIRQLSDRWTSGAWHWEIPPVRTSRDVSLEMKDIYEGLLG